MLSGVFVTSGTSRCSLKTCNSAATRFTHAFMIMYVHMNWVTVCLLHTMVCHSFPGFQLLINQCFGRHFLGIHFCKCKMLRKKPALAGGLLKSCLVRYSPPFQGNERYSDLSLGSRGFCQRVEVQTSKRKSAWKHRRSGTWKHLVKNKVI